MRRSQQAFSAPSKQTQSSNAKDELSSTASINASSTTLIPSSKLLASKPRDCTLKREQNSCYEHDNGPDPSGVLNTFPRLPNTSPTSRPPTTPYGTPVGLEAAKKVMAAADAEAAKNSWAM